VYNGEQYLGKALDSFRAQTFPDFELIISDNASTDRTGEIARAYAARDERIRYHRNPKNLGLAGNHNRVFALAQGKYFKWAAADDQCRPDYLARCVEVLDHHPEVVLAFPKTQFVDSAGNPLDVHDPGWDLRAAEPYQRLRAAIFADHWANAVVGLIRASALAKTRMMPAYPGGDYRVLWELSLLGQFHEIPAKLFLRRLHPGSSSHFGNGGPAPDPKRLARYWKGDDPAVSLPFWNLSLDRLRTILRSQLPWRHRLSLAAALLRRMYWDRQKLLNEVLVGFASYLSKRPTSVQPKE
jgi:glycosyltransferase involved in cell wall biosynthesis